MRAKQLLRLAAAMGLLISTSCLSPGATTCGDLACPAGLRCAPDGARCVTSGQLAACEGRAEGDDCGAGAQCVAEVCTPISCGDGLLMRGEVCDDGNTTSCDGCSADCRSSEGCGNGLVECTEQCDDGAGNADVANANCRSDCRRQRCGDGIVDDRSGEDCDGSPPAAESCVSLGFYSGTLGCSVACRADVSTCAGSCGDGVVNGGELCDGLPPAGQGCQDFGYDVGNLYCGQLCTPSFRTCERLGFVAMPYEGTGFFLYTAWGAGPDDVFAAGYAGTVLRWDGAKWTAGVTGLDETVYGLGGTGPRDVYAVGVRGALAHFDGTAWAAQDAGVTSQLNAVWAASATDVFVGGRGPVMLHSDGGGVWVEQPTPLTGTRVLSLWGSGPRDVFAGGVGEVVHFDGQAWAQQPLPQPVVDGQLFIYSLWGSGPTDVFGVGEAGLILHYDGQAWSTMTSGTTAFLNAVDGTGPDDVWVVGEGGLVLHYDGFSWQRVPTNVTQELSGVSASRTRVIAVAPGTLLEFLPGTPSLTTLQAPTTDSVTAVWASSRSDVLAAAGTEVYRFDGRAWTPLLANSPQSLWFLWGPPGDVFAVGDVGTVLHFDGGSWAPMGTPTSETLNWVWGSSPTDVYAVGDVGTLLHFDGSQWAAVPTNVPGWLYGVWGSGPDDVFAVGEGAAVLHWNGQAWESLDTGTTADLWGVWGAGPNDVYFMADLDGVLHWDGARFAKLSVSSRRSFNYALGSSPTNAWAVEYQGQGLFHFDGVDWAQLSLPPLTTYNLWSRADGTWVGGNNGQVVFYDPHCAARETSCSDRWDNDCDGESNCADADCAGSAYCASGGHCQTLTTIACNTSVTGSTLGGSPHLERYACAERLEPGRERAYRFTPATTGRVRLTLTAEASLAPQLDVVVLASMPSGACDPAGGCRAATGPTGPRSVELAVEAGKTYWVMVEGAGDVAGPFELEVRCP